jgi:hypothetical protein
MKDGYILRSENKTALEEKEEQKELELINNYTRRVFKKGDVYRFSVVLCDNEIDRDNEKFTKESLEKLAELFVGKTGICDHDPKSKNQAARIYTCCVKKVNGQKNKIGEDYYRLVAKAYIPRSAKNEQLILDIDSGIKKEVSVGVSMQKISCSICKSDMKKEMCSHVKGKKYGRKLCHFILENPLDAYEWSFVAVPAQKNAGVIKSFAKKTQFFEKNDKKDDKKSDDPTKERKTNKNEKIIKKLSLKGGENIMDKIMKIFEAQEELLLTKSQADTLKNYINALEKQAEDGKEYRESLQNEVIRFSALLNPEIRTSTIKSLVKKMSLNELREFKTSFEKKAGESILPAPQLYVKKTPESSTKTSAFKI